MRFRLWGLKFEVWGKGLGFTVSSHFLFGISSAEGFERLLVCTLSSPRRNSAVAPFVYCLWENITVWYMFQAAKHVGRFFGTCHSPVKSPIPERPHKSVPHLSRHVASCQSCGIRREGGSAGSLTATSEPPLLHAYSSTGLLSRFVSI